MGCFNDPAWEIVCGGGGRWLTPTTYIQLAGAGSKIFYWNTLIFVQYCVMFSYLKSKKTKCQIEKKRLHILPEED